MRKLNNRLGRLGLDKPTKEDLLWLEETKLRNKTAWLCGAGIGALLIWSQVTMLYLTTHG